MGLFTLIALPIPFLRSLGYAGLLIPFVTVLTTVTLLPALLSAWGVRLDRRHRKRGHRFSAGLGPSGPRWSAWTRKVINRRLAVLGISLVPSGLLVAAASGLHVGELLPTSVAQYLSQRGLRARSTISLVMPLGVPIPPSPAASKALLGRH